MCVALFLWCVRFVCVCVFKVGEGGIELVLHGWGWGGEHGGITIVFIPCYSCRFVFVLLSFFLLYLLLSFISFFLSLSSIVWPHHNQSICTRPQIVIFSSREHAVPSTKDNCRQKHEQYCSSCLLSKICHCGYRSLNRRWVVGGTGQATESI